MEKIHGAEDDGFRVDLGARWLATERERWRSLVSTLQGRGLQVVVRYSACLARGDVDFT